MPRRRRYHQQHSTPSKKTKLYALGNGHGNGNAIELSVSSSNDNDHDLTTSCCSTNQSKAAVIEESVQVDTPTCNHKRKRRETTPMSGLASRAGRTEEAVESAAEKPPTQAEIDAFLDSAEKNMHKKFSEKYNFDFVEEKPIEGSGKFEWTKTAP